MTLHKVNPGDDLIFPAEAFNAIVDLKAAADRRRLDRRAGPIAMPQPRGTVVRVKNETGIDQARFGILGIYAPLWTPTENEADFLSGRTPLRGVTPVAVYYDDSNLDGRYVVLLEPVAAGEIGRAMIGGVTAVKLDVQAEWHFRAEIVHNDTSMLKTHPGGSARVLWKEPGTGMNLWGLVQFPVNPHVEYFGKLDAQWTTGSATVSIWQWNGSAWEDSGFNATVYIPPWIGSFTIAASTWVKLDWHAQAMALYAEPRVSQAVVTDERIDTSSKKLQVKTRTEVGAFVDAESAWTDKYTFVTVTALTYFDVDGANKKLRDKTTQFWAVEVQTESAITDIHTGTVCP